MEQQTRIIETDDNAPSINNGGAHRANGRAAKSPKDGEGDVALWISKAKEVCAEAAKGNLEARILGYTRKDELGEMIHSINRMLDITDAFVRESRAALEYAAKGKFFRRVLLRGLPGSFRSAAQVINSGTEEMERGAGALKGARDKRLKLADDFEQAVRGIVTTVAAASTELTATAQLLAQNASGTTDQSMAAAAASEQTSVNVARVAAATEELTNTVAEVGRQVEDSTKFASGAVNEAERSSTIVHGLSEASKRIGGVVKLISQIAGQTNLLALNATIEAARAGDAGKGFAVVASEVKNLAQQTASATEEIQREIEGIQSISGDTVKAISGIGETIKKMSEIAGAIESAVSEQQLASNEICANINQAATGTKDVSKNISGVTLAAQETSSGASQVLEAAQELSRQSEALQRSVESFLVSVRAD
ncbi:MAG: methyl-accepting chemotaxis protein [Pseudomonadota bacterium]|jgi:methyl-accepting chemotaxis protein